MDYLTVRYRWCVVATLVAIATACWASESAADRYQIDRPYPQQVCRQFTVAEGLPVGRILAISCDGKRPVTVTGENGDAFWDGNRWRSISRARPMEDDNSSRRLAASPSQDVLDQIPRPVPWQPVTATGRDADGRMWIGTPQGAACWTGSRWHAVHSRRWLPNDHVNALCADRAHGMWLATDGGVSHVSFQQMTLEEKADQILSGLRARHVWRGLIRASQSDRPGEPVNARLPSSDNDGLWTALYVAAESFRYAATGSQQARRNATESLDALLFLEEVTGLPGFIARSYVPAGEGPGFGGEWHRSADGRWDWKGDTSSDELDGHMFAWSVYYDLVDDQEHRSRIASTANRVMTRISEDGYYWKDLNGKPTTWGVWAPEKLNHDIKWIAERGLNSLECLSFLKTAFHVTGIERFQQEYERLIRDEAYAMNTVRQKLVFPPNIVNHSDDELAFTVYYPLLSYEHDETLRRLFAMSIRRSWEIERPERSAFFNFVYGSATDQPFDLGPSLRALRDVPLDLYDWRVINSSRADVQKADYVNRAGQVIGTLVLPPSERALMRWNGDPYTLDGGGDGCNEDDGTFFLLPYWMARYHRFLRPLPAKAADGRNGQ